VNRSMIIAIAGAACVATTASAATWTGYNAVIRNDLRSIGDIEGSALVGGSIGGNNIFGSVATSPSGLTLGVGGDVIGNLNINSGDARIRGIVFGGVNNNGGGSITLNDGGISAFIDTVWDEAVSASGAFATLAANSVTATAPGNKLTFDALDGADTAVFSIDASAFSTYQEFVLQRDGASSIVINVLGGASDIDAMATMNSFMSSARDIVWNFVDAAGTLDVMRQIEGSVLAINAHVRQSAVIEGTVVASEGTMNGQEYHWRPFSGDIPSDNPMVPLPAPGAMAFFGLTAVAARRRVRG